MTTTDELTTLLNTRFGGVLRQGKHDEDGKCCALELLSVVHGIPWTDEPSIVRSFDLRALNDIHVPDAVRTQHLLPVLAAYDGSLDWPVERRRDVVERLAIRTTNVLIAELPGLPDDARRKCREAKTLIEARAASDAARAASDAARAASDAARAASDAAEMAADAAYHAVNAAAADRERSFIAACQVWLEAATTGDAA